MRLMQRSDRTFKQEASFLVPLWTVVGLMTWGATGYPLCMLFPVLAAAGSWVRTRGNVASPQRSTTTSVSA